MIEAPFPLWPDGASPLVETFTETTAVEVAFNGTERRRICRASPRYGLSASFICFDNEATSVYSLFDGKTRVVPAWMHPLRDGKTAVQVHGPGTRLFAYRSPTSAPLVSTERTVIPSFRRNLLDLTTSLARPAAYYPAVTCSLSEDAIEAQMMSKDVVTTQLSFTCDNFTEGLQAYGVMYYFDQSGTGYPVLPEANNWTAQPVRQGAFNRNVFDAGNLADYQHRHTKGSIAVRFDLTSRASALAFRSFLLMLRGRYQAFAWRHSNQEFRFYRLASDTWSLEWRGTDYASCSLRFLEL